MKKIILVVFLSICLIGCGKKTDFEKYNTSDTTIFEYELNDDIITILGFGPNYKNESSIVIPYSIDNYVVNKIEASAFKESRLVSVNFSKTELKEIGESAFASCEKLEYVVLNDEIELIGNSAFSNCLNIEKMDLALTKIESISDELFMNCENLDFVSIPDSLKEVQKNSFSNCSKINELDLSNTKLEKLSSYSLAKMENLVTVKLPDTLKIIEDNVFLDDVKLKTINLNNSLESIGANAFKSCSSLISLAIPSSVEKIGDNAFEKCSGLKQMDLSKTMITSVPSECFASCTSLENVLLPSGLLSIKEKAFAHSGLKSIIISSDVTEIGNLAFNQCKSLLRIMVDYENENYKDNNGVLYSKDGKSLIQYPMGITNQTYSMLETTEVICESAFRGSMITSIDFTHTNVKEIKENAFWECHSLASVTFGEDLETIGYSSFYDCINLVSISFEENINLIKESAFYGCSNLVNVDLRNTQLKSIEQRTFQYCKMETIYLPSSLETIGKSAFGGSSIESVYLDSRLILVNLIEVEDCGYLTFGIENLYVNNSIDEYTPNEIKLRFNNRDVQGSYSKYYYKINIE